MGPRTIVQVLPCRPPACRAHAATAGSDASEHQPCTSALQDQVRAHASNCTYTRVPAHTDTDMHTHAHAHAHARYARGFGLDWTWGSLGGYTEYYYSNKY